MFVWGDACVSVFVRGDVCICSCMCTHVYVFVWGDACVNLGSCSCLDTTHAAIFSLFVCCVVLFSFGFDFFKIGLLW